MRVLVVNAGSSSLKLTLLDGEDRALASRELAAPRATIAPLELRAALDGGLGAADVVGHRIVHGGERFRSAVLIDARVEAELRDLVDLAPLHQPKSLAALDIVAAALPHLPAVACFDTAFHATLPPAAYIYALPRKWRERWGVRRYGFHGLSHAWATRRAGQLVPAARRIVTCHLGAGASLAAVLDGHSVDTTMGFTPLDGLVMATRCGSVDPGLLLWIEEHEGLPPREVAHSLEHSSGLVGLADTADMREILSRADADARLALDVYLHRLTAGIAAMTASLGGLDCVVFTGGVGEHAAEVRERAAGRLAYLGVSVDQRLNSGAEPDADISAADAAVRTLVVTSREDLEIAAGVERLLGRG
ncbi:MAG: acetate/propionate family kinase [Actinomycetota bacterium]|nr:acetate/propionate family kinase [Actinomycetota bacterium]